MSDPVPRDLLAIEVAIAMAVIGVASERRGLQRRARRSYFGKGRVLSCGSMDFEASGVKRKANRIGASWNAPPSLSLDAPGTWG